MRVGEEETAPVPNDDTRKGLGARQGTTARMGRSQALNRPLGLHVAVLSRRRKPSILCRVNGSGGGNVLDVVELQTGDEIRASVLWLHGLGANGHDFESIVPHLGLPASLGVRFVFPHAPLRAVTINNGYVMRAWYDVMSPDLAICLGRFRLVVP